MKLLEKELSSSNDAISENFLAAVNVRARGFGETPQDRACCGEAAGQPIPVKRTQQRVSFFNAIIVAFLLCCGGPGQQLYSYETQ